MTDEKQCIYYAEGLIQSMSKNEPIDFYGQSVRIINHEIDYKYPGDIDFVFMAVKLSSIIAMKIKRLFAKQCGREKHG
jgi:hypothetical protein